MTQKSHSDDKVFQQAADGDNSVRSFTLEDNTGRLRVVVDENEAIEKANKNDKSNERPSIEEEVKGD